MKSGIRHLAYRFNPTKSACLLSMGRLEYLNRRRWLWQELRPAFNLHSNRPCLVLAKDARHYPTNPQGLPKRVRYSQGAKCAATCGSHARFTAKYRGVRQVSTTDFSDPPTNERRAAGSVAPVLARVPWLNSSSTDLLPTSAPLVEPTVFDATLLASHSVMVWSAGDSAGCDTALPGLRIDPPVSTRLSPPEIPDAPLSTAITPSPARSAPVLRFDPPEHSAVKHVTRAHSERNAHVSAWHHGVASIDNAIRQYHKVIVLAALLTAAGLMMLLVLESQHPIGEPAPETLTPSASTAANDIEPLPLAGASAAPMTDSTTNANSARGPKSDTHRRTVSVEAGETVLEPLEATSLDDEQITPIVDKPGGATVTAPTEADPETMVVGYPDTNKRAFVWPDTTDLPNTPAAPPSLARLSPELQPANQQTTK